MPETKINFTTRPSALPGADGKRYGTVIPNGTIDAEGIIDRMVRRGCKMRRTEIRYFLNALNETVAAQLKEHICAVDLGFCCLRPVIEGSFEHEDDKFDAKRHKLVIEATLSRDIQRAVAKGLKAVNVTPKTVQPPSIDSVCQAPDYVRNTFSASAQFEIHGTGLTTDHGDESAELELPSGVLVPVTLKRQTKADGSRRVRAELAEPLPAPRPKRARLIFRTHGLGGAKSQLFTVKSASLTLRP